MSFPAFTDFAGDALPDSVVSRRRVPPDGLAPLSSRTLLSAVSSLRALHPSPQADERASLGSLRRVASRAAPVADVDQVRKAVHSFPSTSGAGRSGLRPSHIRDAVRPASSDLLLRLITEVVNLLLQGEVPESVRPFVCGASIMAFRKPNGTLRPIAAAIVQGDPLGPALSALAIHSIIQEARQDTERSFPSGLDICAFYLDDGICARSALAVSFFLSSLAFGLGRLGLVVNLSKTEVIPACTRRRLLARPLPGCTWNGSASFKLLGAAIEPPDWCEILLGRRVAKARALIDAIGRRSGCLLPPQVLFWVGQSPLFLSHCSARCAASRPPCR